MKLGVTILIIICALNTIALAQTGTNPYYSRTDNKKLTVPDAEWKKILSPGVYKIAREQGTEQAFSGDYWDNHKEGTYYCGACGNPLFSSKTKFESGTGWPSFFQPLTKNSVGQKTDNSYGMERSEVTCARCGSHLGHVFDDGPKPTGKRYCMNGNVLDFAPAR